MSKNIYAANMTDEELKVRGAMPAEKPGLMSDGEYDLICLSHLRWDFVYQRPQHLLSRFASEYRVFFVEEPVFVCDQMAYLDVSKRADGLHVVVPRLPKGLDESEIIISQQLLINELIEDKKVRDYVLWYYTPMALAFTRHLKPLAIVYDCMDELSAFRGAPRALKEMENELLSRADVAFTGGQSLYEAKRSRHSNIYAMPSSTDAAHFASARKIKSDPADQAGIPHPRLGFFGVIDERMDVTLLDQIAKARPDWHLIMIGPVVKIDPEDLPRRQNIHYLGGKDYQELPAYLAGWDVALMPFARNESTRFISPTKTPEYLAAGKPVISTSIRDVVRTYGEWGLVRIADSVEEFVAAVEAALSEDANRAEWIRRVDGFLAENSWDHTWARMKEIIRSAIKGRAPATPVRANAAKMSESAGADAFAIAD